eukprot:gene13873-18606_t
MDNSKQRAAPSYEEAISSPPIPPPRPSSLTNNTDKQHSSIRSSYNGSITSVSPSKDIGSEYTTIPIHILTKYGILTKSNLIIEVKSQANKEGRIYWRSNPILGCEMSNLVSISTPIESTLNKSSQQLILSFTDSVKLHIEISNDKDGEIVQSLYNKLYELLNKSQHIASTEKELNGLNPIYQHLLLLKHDEFHATMKQEILTQLNIYLRFKEAYMSIEKVKVAYKSRTLLSAFQHWVLFVKDVNYDKMTRDRNRWRLHAIANQDIDLQAWYHAVFYQEVYRLRGQFWYKDAVLPVYKQSYDLVDNVLTPLEEAALAHVLCSPDTSYGDVAGQMFVVQSLISPKQFALFQQLAAQGAQVVKYPRSGRPAKKLFRFSFVEGNIYLTWKGKFGNQGVGMGEVTAVMGGIQTDVLRWTAQPAKTEQYLSVICSDRSVDLFFESEEERNNWRDLLKAIVTKEQGTLVGIESVDPPADADEFEWMILNATIGKNIV